MSKIGTTLSGKKRRSSKIVRAPIDKMPSVDERIASLAMHNVPTMPGHPDPKVALDKLWEVREPIDGNEKQRDFLVLTAGHHVAADVRELFV